MKLLWLSIGTALSIESGSNSGAVNAPPEDAEKCSD